MDISLPKQNMSRHHSNTQKKEEAPKKTISSFEKETSSILQKYLGQENPHDDITKSSYTSIKDTKESLSKEEQQNIQKYTKKDKKHIVFLSV